MRDGGGTSSLIDTIYGGVSAFKTLSALLAPSSPHAFSPKRPHVSYHNNAVFRHSHPPKVTRHTPPPGQIGGVPSLGKFTVVAPRVAKMATESTTSRNPAAWLEPSSASLTTSDTMTGHTSETRLADLCSACQSLLIRPTCNPETQRGTFLTDPGFVLHRLADEVRHTKDVCFICRLVMAAFQTIEQHLVTAEWIHGFEISLRWFTNGHFGNIHVVPIDNNDRRIAMCESHYGIMLSPTDGIVLKPYLSIMRLRF